MRGGSFGPEDYAETRSSRFSACCAIGRFSGGYTSGRRSMIWRACQPRDERI